MTMRRAVLASVLSLVAGCDLYFGGGGDDVVCNGGWGGAPEPAQQLRDPNTGVCQSFYGGDGGYCDDACGPCPAYDVAPTPDWGVCYGMCEGLDESGCLAAPGCFAAYEDLSINSDPRFFGCWATAPSGPVGGSCANLDAYSCSRHDNCVAIYDGRLDSYGSTFTRCEAEPTVTPGSCATTDCGMGYHCEEQCYPSDDPVSPNEMASCSPVCVPDRTCASTDCGPGYSCADVCEVDSNGHTTCNAVCVPTDPNDPGQCTGAVLCNSLPPACPSGTVAGISNGCWSGYCIPTNDCGPNDPGTCGQAACTTPPPACPSGTVAGVKNGCWSGYCIPQNQCPLAACETLSTEASCVSRGDCTPVYEGTDCTCYPSGCSCENLTYERCESLLMPLGN